METYLRLRDNYSQYSELAAETARAVLSGEDDKAAPSALPLAAPPGLSVARAGSRQTYDYPNIAWTFSTLLQTTPSMIDSDVAGLGIADSPAVSEKTCTEDKIDSIAAGSRSGSSAADETSTDENSAEMSSGSLSADDEREFSSVDVSSSESAETSDYAMPDTESVHNNARYEHMARDDRRPDDLAKGTFVNPVHLRLHNTQTTYKKVCAFSCRSTSWFVIGHIRTNVFRCPNLATGKYFCDVCYKTIMNKKNGRSNSAHQPDRSNWRNVNWREKRG